MGPHRAVIDERFLTEWALVPHLPGVSGLVLSQLVPPDEGLTTGLTLVRLLIHVVASDMLIQLVLSVVCFPTEVTFKVSRQGLV